MTKMTYVQAIDFAVDMIQNGEANFNGFTASEYIEKLDALKAQLAKRAIRKPSKNQVANEGVKNDILDILYANEGLRCGDIAEPLGISGQKCSALLRQLVDAGLVEKYTEKRVTYFKRVAQQPSSLRGRARLTNFKMDSYLLT